jgi:hypothetical protein
MNPLASSDAPMNLDQTITIHTVFGSEIQRDVSMKVLLEFLRAWQQTVESAHKKNKVMITPEP